MADKSEKRAGQSPDPRELFEQARQRILAVEDPTQLEGAYAQFLFSTRDLPFQEPWTPIRGRLSVVMELLGRPSLMQHPQASQVLLNARATIQADIDNKLAADQESARRFSLAMASKHEAIPPSSPTRPTRGRGGPRRTR